MSPLPRHRRAGMTLVELLVVVVILLVLAATVLPLLAGTAEARRSREAARTVASFIAKAQSRSIGREQWSGFEIVPTGTNTSIGMTLYLADVPPPYMGDSASTRISGTGPAGSTWSGTTALAGELTTGTATTNPGDLVRLNGRSPFFEAVSMNTGTLQLRLRDAAATENTGQSSLNTPWPTPAPASHSFEIFRRPIASGPPMILAENRAIDISCCGTGTVGAYATFGVGTRIGVLFDGSGRFRQIITTSSAGVVSRSTVTGPLFLLVGRADRTVNSPTAALSATDDATAANWKYGDSIWVALDPVTGQVRTAACDTRPTVVSGTLPSASQTWIRQLLLESGR